MTINSLKELEKLIKLCRRSGTEAIKIDNIELHLGKLPLKASSRPKAINYTSPEENIKIPQFNGPTVSVVDDIDTEGLSDEDLLFYSATGESQ